MTFLLLAVACGNTTLPVGDPVNGEALFAAHCASCHAADGTGGSGQNLVNIVPSRTEQELTDTIQNGFGDMRATGLGDQDAADVVAWLIDSWG